MRILVTGASGFVGRALASALSGLHEMRTAERGAVSDAMAGCQAIVHLANIAHTSAPPGELWRVNVEGTRRVAELAALAGVKRLVYLSSVKASCEETTDRPLTGGETPAPTTEYGRTKLAAEKALAEVSAQTGIEVVSLRPPLVYGPGVKANFLVLLRAIARGWPLPFASIANRRSLLYVGNLADAIIASVRAPAAAMGRAYVLCDGGALSTPQLCVALGRAWGRKARLFRFPPALLELDPSMKRLTRSLEIDDAATRETLAWRPPFLFEDGLDETALWYRSSVK